jgi:3-dehydroquinate dehydratase II
MRILVIDGPNMNLIGTRQTEIYGRVSLVDIEKQMRERAASLEVGIEFTQSNCEGELIDRLHAAREHVDGLIINPAGLSHTSVALLDAMLAMDCPVIEVHLTNLARREDFRKVSLTAEGAEARIEGFGADGYLLALDGLVRIIGSNNGS